jgi:hypothetical protein
VYEFSLLISPLIIVVLEEVLGPARMEKFDSLGATNRSPFSLMVKVKLNCSFTPTLFLLTKAVKEVCAISKKL